MNSMTTGYRLTHRGSRGGMFYCGMPDRFAQEALGHNSKAVHRAYAKNALVKIPSLQEYEERVSGL